MFLTCFFAAFLGCLVYDLFDLIFYTSVPCVVINDKGKDVITLIRVKRKYRKQVCLELNKYSDVEID